MLCISVGSYRQLWCWCQWKSCRGCYWPYSDTYLCLIVGQPLAWKNTYMSGYKCLVDKRQKVMLCHNTWCHLGQSENLIFCVMLASCTCSIWQNILSRIYQNIGCLFKGSVDRIITLESCWARWWGGHVPRLVPILSASSCQALVPRCQHSLLSPWHPRLRVYERALYWRQAALKEYRWVMVLYALNYNQVLNRPHVYPLWLRTFHGEGK